MSDRVAVFNHGRIEQIGPPAEVYEHPANEFVASFVGVSNVLERGSQRFSVPAARRSGSCSMRRTRPMPSARVEAGTVREVVYQGRDPLRRRPGQAAAADRGVPEPRDDLGAGPHDARHDRAARVAPEQHAANLETDHEEEE